MEGVTREGNVIVERFSIHVYQGLPYVWGCFYKLAKMFLFINTKRGLGLA